jgi:hypothetical protein
MTTTGTSAFNLDLNEIVEEAFERCGSELRSGYDLRTARRSLNLLAIEWANAGINLWTIEKGEIPLVAGQTIYDLPVDTIDLLEHVIRTGSGQSQQDISISRISVSTYAVIPNKNTQGRPLQVWINRRSGADYPGTGEANPQINVWPVPDSSTPYTFVYWRLRRLQDAGSGVNTPDIPFRFLPALIAGLAFHLSLKIPEASVRSADLKLMYDEAMQKAMDEDREKAPLRLAPRQQIL